MDAKTYNKIKSLCAKYLAKSCHDRHLEDCTQDAALNYWRGRTNVQYSVIDYCRKNGLTKKRAKQAAVPLERSTLFESEFKDEQRVTQDEEDQFRGALEEFLSPLKLSKEARSWTVNNFKLKT